ncbi:MAG: hypothetical protein V4671_18195 [Armatimonadota bacterium]
MTEEQRWRTAIHEAGHAVMAELLNVKFDKVILKFDPSNKSEGYISIIRKIGESDRTLENVGFVALAGSIAEICYLEPNGAWYIDRDARNAIQKIMDIYYYRDFYDNLTKEEKKNFIKFVLEEKKKLVFAFFNDAGTAHVTRHLARLLMRRNRLSQASVRSLNLRSRLKSRYAKQLREFAAKRQWI